MGSGKITRIFPLNKVRAESLNNSHSSPPMSTTLCSITQGEVSISLHDFHKASDPALSRQPTYTGWAGYKISPEALEGEWLLKVPGSEVLVKVKAMDELEGRSRLQLKVILAEPGGNKVANESRESSGPGPGRIRVHR